MDDPYLTLAVLLQEKERAVPADVNSVREGIKLVADRLRHSSVNGSHLDAAFAYYVAGYYVRASRLISQTDIDDSAHPAQRWLALVLSKHFKIITEQTQEVIVDVKYSDPQLQYEITSCGLSDFAALDRILIRKVAEALSAFAKFAHHGYETELDNARSVLGKCQLLACNARESHWWWWIECIRLVISEYAANCLWTQLQSMRRESGAGEMVTKYIVANYERSNPVVELWRTQVESLDRVNDPERSSFCLAIPTSSGKTRVAELAILRFLIDYRDAPTAKCIYIAPLRKLANEVEQTLSPVFSAVVANPRVVSSFYGGQEIDPLDENELISARILIVTPEKLDGMLRHDRNLRSQIRLVIADEGHMIGDDSFRGYRYRMLLDRLVYSLKIKKSSAESRKTRLLFVSGVLPNVDEFAELITGDRSNKVNINWRPLDAPSKERWEWDGGQLKGSSASPPPIPIALPGCNSPSEFEDVIVRVAFTTALSSHTMVFSASKKAIESNTLLDLLECLLDQHPLGNHPLPRELGKRSPFEKYYSILESGAAVHHSGLPADLKKETEARIYDGRVRLLFASPTLAQGVNIPFDTILVYRLQHFTGNAIHDSIFWNVVGRVGRPVAASAHTSQNLNPPKVVFLINKSSRATKEDKIDAITSSSLIKHENRYRVATPFLQFLNEVRKEWVEHSGQSVANLVKSLSERSDLQWITNPKTRKDLSALLRLLDEHLIALIEETGAGEKADEWIQDRSAEVIDLLIGATSIEPDDLEFIKDAVLARAKFVANNISHRQRRQDYLLGLPLEDCEEIRANKDSLLIWYQGCTDIFARRLDSGIGMLIQLLDFVSSLSICPRKWRSKRPEPLPLFGQTVLDADTVNRSALFKGWILGEDIRGIAGILEQLKPDADFAEYREEMLERNLAWGLSAISRFLNTIAEEKGMLLTRDLDFLPSLVKYGVPSKLACFLVKLMIPREAATRIAELYINKINSDDALMEELNQSTFAYAEMVVRSLADDDITTLHIDENAIERIREIKARSLVQAR